jgi:tetratricopeptide (TPR) repeat protein
MSVAVNDLAHLRQRLEAAQAAYNADRIGEAAQAYRAIVAEIPDQPDALYMLAAIAFRMGRMELAVQLYDETLKASPGFALAWSNRAAILRLLGREEEALASARKAIACDPNLADGWDLTGLLLRERRQCDVALQHHARAEALNPRSKHVQNNYAVALAATNRLEEAYQAARKALSIDPAFAIAHMTLGNILSEAGWPERAIYHYRKAAALDPSLAHAVSSEGRSLMLIGDMESGWVKMESRSYDAERFKDIPRWRGEKTGRLLLYAEQGIGDIAQFLRYVPLIRDRAAEIAFEAPSSMRRLLAAQMPGSTIVSPDDPLPSADAHELLMSLPLLCKTRLENIPRSVPYIRAEEEWRKPWRERLALLPRPHIGIVWMGNPLYPNDHNRSIAFDIVRPLIDAARPHLVSMQKGSTTATASNACIFDADPWLRDYADTAGLIAELDLVIAVDTGVAHLAGAMGKPVWTLLYFAPDWRWMYGRQDSPWYPTMRLFRQKAPRSWKPVIEHVAGELRRFIAGDTSVLSPPAWNGKIWRQNPSAVPLPDEPARG